MSALSLAQYWSNSKQVAVMVLTIRQISPWPSSERSYPWPTRRPWQILAAQVRRKRKCHYNFVRVCIYQRPHTLTYTTGENPCAPPHPINIIANVNVEITKLFIVNCYFRAAEFLYLPYESQCSRIGKPLIIVANVGDLGGEIKLPRVRNLSVTVLE